MMAKSGGQYSGIEVWVGLFVVAGVLALTMLAFQVSGAGNAAGGDTYRISASFNNVGGLNEKAPVMVGGVRIGRVSAIEIDKESYRAVVQMDISAHYDNLPIDTSASIFTAGLLGAQFVGLGVGGDDLYLGEGDQLELTQDALQLEELIGQFLFSQGEDGS